MTLDLAPVRCKVQIDSITGDDALVQRLMEFGLFEGEIIETLDYAPLGDPLEIRCGQSRLSLRRSEARCLTVTVLG